MSDIAVVKFLFRKDWSPLEEVIDKFSKEFGDIYDVGDDRDIIQVVSTSPATLVFACITDKDDLTKVLGFLKLQRRYVKDGNLKFAVINFLNNKQVEMALLKLGCQEVIDPGLKAKALKFKMDFWKKSLSVGTNKILEGAQVQSLKEKVAADKKAAAAEDKKAAQVKPITWTDALKVVDDMWLTKNPNDVKKILNRWMVKLMGPSPFVAQWLEVKGERNVWEFVFKDGVRENFHMADGSWFFSGDQKPEFIWKDNVWLITGQKFQLFYQDDTKVDYRLKATAQSVEVTKNSNYAISREQAIIDSFDQELLVKKGLIDESKTELEGTKDTAGDGLLTEEVDGAEDVQKHYKGKLSHRKEEADDERSDVDGSAERIKTKYDGKSSSEDLGPSHYNGKLEHGGASESAKRQQRRASEDELESEDSGEAGTDDIGPTKYKGRLEYGEAQRKSRTEGKSETDDLGDSHYSNQPGSSVASLKKERAHDEDSEDAELGEDPEVDHLGRRKAHPLDAKRRSHDKGEADTDDLGANHWSNKKAPGQRSDEASDEKQRSLKQPGSSRKTRDDDSDETSGEAEGRERPLKKAAKPRASSAFEDEDESDDQSKEAADRERPLKKSVKPRVSSAFEEDEEEAEIETSADKKRGTTGDASSAKGRLGGKSSTDDLGSSHYGKPTATKKTSSSRESDEEDAEDSEELSPASSIADLERRRLAKATPEKKASQGTDDLGKKHYAGKINRADSGEENDELDDVEEARGIKKKYSAKKPGEAREREADAEDATEAEDDPKLMPGHERKKLAKPQRSEKAAFDEDADDEDSENESSDAPGEMSRKKAKIARVGKTSGEDRDEAEEQDERRDEEAKRSSDPREKRARSIADLLPDGNADEDLNQSREEFNKVSEQSREKKMRSIADLLPDGNAEDPQEEIRPRGEASERAQDGTSRARVKPHLVKSPAESEESERSSVEAKAKAAVPSLADTAPIGEDGKPVVAAEAKVVVILRKKSEPGVERIIQLDDFFEDTAIIHMHGNPLVAGEAIELTMTFEYMERTKRIQVNGVCLESDANDEGEAFCTIKIEATQLKIFEQFMLLYQLRQQHIHSFLKAAKGY